jgi:hypothetical protein
MQEKMNENNRRFDKVIFVLSLFVLIFCLAGSTFNMYRVAFVGALFELLWLPAILLLFVLPVFSFVNWVKQKFRYQSFYLYSLIINIATIGMIVYFK